VPYIYINADQNIADCDFHEAKNIEKRCKFEENQLQLHTIIYYTVSDVQCALQASQKKKYD
jgi:hypothetical protein